MSNLVNHEGTLMTLSAAPAGTTYSATQKNYFCKGVVLHINITAGAATTVVFTIEGLDPVSGTAYTILASASLGTGYSTMRVYPNLTASANTIANDIIPVSWRLKSVVTGANGITGTVDAAVIM